MRDKILQLVQIKGPILPVDIRSAMKVDSMIVSAFLSELIKGGKVKSSHAKIGSSPLYYVNGQEKELEQLREYLHPKTRETFDLLKEKKVLPDEDLSEVMKASIRDLKDFALPLKVNKTILIWKFYAVAQEEAIEIIKSIMQKPKAPIPQPIQKEDPMEITIKQEIVEEKPAEKIETELEGRKEEVIIQRISPQIKRVEPEIKIEDKKVKIEERVEQIIEKPEVKKQEVKVKEDIKIKKEESSSKSKNKKIKKEDRSSKDLEEIEEAKEIKTAKIEDPLLDKVKEYFKEREIIIKKFDVVRKEREIELTITVPSVIGRISYFCIVRDKKKCNDGDVSAAVIKGQMKNLPTLFLTTGEVTKKALEMVGREFKQLTIKNLRDD
jgi:hypothetical protein